ncbi:cupredoxin domain-containing protein [Microbulbifer sp. OS29]|uniref:Cupredoxin domain-containing protein n=1 Tax=Microbulbifer okhotskensis TaxID=2926617 RepID=A0A9X2J517_9GAMM|nr:cupredoxin domain-containing protein [Microbulbifer okhotskensis]MCO1334738.1 cupredoxin domain-containing protein [Microbulbifer okhotskensis]
MAIILVNAIGLLIILAVIWWFWLGPKRSAGQLVSSAGKLQILVKDGVYEPDRIRLPAGCAVTLYFRREDPSPCSEWVLFPDLEVSAELALNKATPVEIPEAEPGEYPFNCQMQMYRGTLILE